MQKVSLQLFRHSSVFCCLCRWIFITLHICSFFFLFACKQAAPICCRSNKSNKGAKFSTSKLVKFCRNNKTRSWVAGYGGWNNLEGKWNTFCTLMVGRSALKMQIQCPEKCLTGQEEEGGNEWGNLWANGWENGWKMGGKRSWGRFSVCLCKFQVVNLWLWHLVNRGKM